ncbi:Peroxiredoxin [bacterium A37T11]|nr:Peroxiredoxin [bacterium A37T11]
MLLLLSAFPLGAMAQQPFTLKAKVNHIHYPAKAFLWYQDHGRFLKDSAEVTHNTFTLKGQVSEPMKAIVILLTGGKKLNDAPAPDQIGVYLENGTILLQSADSLTHARISGTPLNKDQQELTDLMASFKKEENRLNEAYKKAEGKDADQVAIKDTYTALSLKKEKAQIAFVKSHPGSLVSLNLIRSAFNPVTDPPKSRMLIGMLSKPLQESAPAKRFLAALEKAKKVEIGSMAPDFSMKNTHDSLISLSSFRGKYVLLDFWASWCVPCRKENPNVIKAYNQHKDKNFTVLGVSLDGGTNAKSKWLDAITKDGLPYEQVSDLQGSANAAANMYLISEIPSNFLIDPTGKIIAKNLRGEELSSTLEKVLNHTKN